MSELSFFWLRVAAGLYAFGLIHALLTVLQHRVRLFGAAFGTFALGVVLHLVSIVEKTAATGYFPANDFYESLSLCAFLIASLYLFVFWRYKLESLSVFVFPLVFVTTLASSLGGPMAGWSDSRVRDAWLVLHVLLVLAGFAALFIAAVASIVYLRRERQLKSKKPSTYSKNAPALGTLDDLITRAMAVGFVLITLAVIAGSFWASIESGTSWIRNGRIIISLLTWGIYLVMVFLRASAGWRGRKAAIMIITIVGCSAVTWAAHTSLRSFFER